ncbi:MAG: ATP-binding protein [Anaerolineae bacterium]|nr:ATP-binding protein [Anaerolineae bacterium]
MVDASADDLEYTLAHLARLDLLIRREVIRLRLQTGDRPDEEFRGLYVSDEEADRLLEQGLSLANLLLSPLPTNDTLASIADAVLAVEGRIASIQRAARERGSTLKLDRLGQLFGLNSFERQVILICLAAEMDLKYERLFAYLQDDVTKKRPTIHLVLRLLCPDVEARLQARASFEPQAPLSRWELVTLHEDPGARRAVLLSRYLKLDERVVGYLLGSDQIEHRLEPIAASAASNGTESLPADVRSSLSQWATAWEESWAQVAPVLLFHGRYGTGKRAAAAFLASSLGRPLLLLSAASLATGDLPLDEGLKLAEREALLTDALLCWSDAGPFLQPEPGGELQHRLFVQALARSSVPTVLLAEKPWEPARELEQRPFLRLEMRDLTYAERRALWLAGLDGRDPPLNDEELDALAGRFRLTAGQIQDALARARTLAWTRDPSNGHVTALDIDAACRGQAQNRLGTLARKLEPRYVWDDIVLPRAQLTTLHLMCTTVRQRPTVYGSWGFDRKLSLGKGLIALFAGPSGTGKTMAAEIIANDLGLDLYKIDLSAVVSKYIGETEKNLERIFSEAQDSDAILFFDEADALFGKRSEVKDAHDRYANIEIAYLLQRTEEYNGLVILASNVKKNMDEAFVRRLHFTVDFPFPEEAERLEIWHRTFPAQAPRAQDIDLPFLARKLKIAGGNIRNIILTAAFVAAEEHEPIAMRHLVRGAGYEYQKMGKLVVESDFERYFNLMHP